MAMERVSTTYSKIYDEIFEFLTSAPMLEQISEFRLSDESEAYLDDLLVRNRNGVVTPNEKAELENFGHLEHFVRMFKIKAAEKPN